MRTMSCCEALIRNEAATRPGSNLNPCKSTKLPLRVLVDDEFASLYNPDPELDDYDGPTVVLKRSEELATEARR